MKVVLGDGSMVIYKDKETNVSDEELDKLPINFMDCMDCHNRPSHIFFPPEKAVDQAMAGGNISPKLPWIKKLALDALVKNYGDKQNILEEIRQFIEGYFTKHYPDVLKNQKVQVDQAIDTIFAIYNRNVFLTMKVNWTTYPNNIGHRNWPGCFRCHNDRHISQMGKVLTSSCPVCHTMPQRSPLLPLGATTPVSTQPWHPWPLKGKHGRILCHLCHRAGFRPALDCISCHKIDTSTPMMSMSCKTCHLKEAEVLPMVNCKSCHGNLGGLHKKGEHATITCGTCHAPHLWKVTKRETCLPCHDNKKTHYAPTSCGECHKFAVG
jgi:hypothetical protein